MPNMPSMVEEGMSCLVTNKNISKQNKNIVTNLFGKIGKIHWLSTEKELDKVTAISGSGPGYYFLFIDSLEKVAVKLGFTKKIAKELVYQTAFGSIKLLINNSKSAEKLANDIAIKGGTTEAAIRFFKKDNQLKNMINKAVKAAYKRAIELSKK
jgi:pyrroline-5-carboxylate reductase